MPMDIRNFFGKAAAKPNSGKGAKKPDSGTSVATAAAAAKSKPPSKAATPMASAKTTTVASRRPAAAAKETSSAKAVSQQGARRSSNSTAAVKSNKAAIPPDKKPSPAKVVKSSGEKKTTHGSKQRQAISVDTDDDDDDEMEDAPAVPTAKQKQQPPKQDLPHSNKRKSRVIVDYSDDDDDEEKVVVVEESKTNTRKSPAKKAKSPSPAKKSKPSAEDSNMAVASQSRLNPRRSSSSQTKQDAAISQLKETREEVSVEDFFGGNSRTRATKEAIKKVTTAPVSETKMKNVKELHDDEDDDGDENYMDVHDEEEDEEEDENEFDDDEEVYDKKAKAKKAQTVRQTSTKRKMETKADDDDDEPPPRKSPRKQSSKSPKLNDTPAKSASRTSPRKQPTKASSLSAKAKAPTFVPLEPGLKMESFDLDAVVVPECLAGATFVFSGLMPELNREDAQDLVKSLGGRVTGTVSNKTTYLVLGEILEDGRAVIEGKKYQLAKEKGVRLVQGEKELYGLAKLYHDRAVERQSGSTPKRKVSSVTATSTVSATSAVKVVVADKASAEASMVQTEAKSRKGDLKPPPSQAPITNVYTKKPPPSVAPPLTAVFNPYAKKIANPYASQKPKSKSSNSSQPVAASNPSVNADTSNRLWADKYAPEVSEEVLGNKDMVDKLSKWLQRWEANFSGKSKVKTSDSGPKKAALLSGPPGIGKTTTANLVGKEAGRDILEFNASDVRSKKALQNDLGDVTGSQSINFAAPSKNGKPQSATRKRVLIMDEVDGMGAGDRQGMAELIKMIKASHVPIICICNDRQSQKIRSLVPYCLDLRFRRPSKSVIANRAIKVASLEGLQVERNAAEAIAESCGNDVRQVLNCLQMWASQGNQERMTYKDLKDRENFINKDDILRVNIFDATKMIVEGRKGLNDADKRAQVDSFYKRNDAFFVDYSLMGLNVHQNYMKVLMAPFNDVKRTEDPDKMIDFLDRIHDAAHAMSDFAVVEKEIRGGDMNWSLLPFSGVLAVKTGFHAGGENGSFFPGFPDFPAWMGKNSTRGKKSRILQELSYHMNYKVSGGRTALRLSYVPTLRERLYSMITNADESDTTNAIHLMDEYGLDRDDVFEKLDEFKIDSKIDFGKIDGKAKASFTREYNSASHRSQALVAEQGNAGSKRKRAGASNGEKDPADLDAIDEDGPAEPEESDGDAEEEDFEKIKKIFGKSRGGRKSGGKATARGGAKTNGGKATASGGGSKASGRQNKRSKK